MPKPETKQNATRAQRREILLSIVNVADLRGPRDEDKSACQKCWRQRGPYTWLRPSRVLRQKLHGPVIGRTPKWLRAVSRLLNARDVGDNGTPQPGAGSEAGVGLLRARAMRTT
ncbi:hypothetical protein MRX96_005570 [Rhipicephalus microplus]